MLQDLTHAVRMLFQTKGWTAVVLVSLALGIGANTALFTAINGVMIQTLPVPHPETLVKLKWTGENNMMRSSSDYGFSQPVGGRNVRATFAHTAYLELRKANQTLTDLIGSAPIGPFNVVVNNEADLASAIGVTGNYFHVLGVPPALGRVLTEDDDQPGAAPVAVISHAFWRRRFSSDPDIAGKAVSMNNVQVTIVGVTPVGFNGAQRLGVQGPEVTVPISLDAQFNLGQTRLTQPVNWWVQLMGRLKPGVTLDQVRGNFEGVLHSTARAGMDAYMNGLTAEQRALSTNQRRGTSVPILLVQDGSRGIYDVDTNTTRTARILGGVVVAVLLIVCANVANLLISRATARRKEIAVRLSMGATRARLIRQLLTESLLLAGAGGALGIAIGYWSRLLLPFGQDVPVDWRMFGFVAGLSVLTGVLFGLAPAFRTTRVDLASVMKEESRSVAGGRTLLSKALLVTQVALSLVLVIGAGLFVRTVYNLRSVDIGFNPDKLLMFNVNPQLNRYDADRSRTLFHQLQDELKAVPGVQSNALTRVALLSGSTSTSVIHVQGKPSWAGPSYDDNHIIYMMAVSPEFFDTLQIPLRGGRRFADSDSPTSPKVAILNEAAAKKYFPGESALGRRVGFSPETNGEYEVVAVVGDTKYNSLREPAPPTMYQAFYQGPARGMNFILRTASDPAGMIETVRAAVRRVDPNLPITNVATQTDQLERRFASERLFANALSIFGGLALLLASIGLFGLMSYNVSRRTNEIGIRMALGAQRTTVVGLVVRESLLLVAAGIAVGLLAAVMLAKLPIVTTLMFGLQPGDGVKITLVVLAIVGLVSILAGYLPARRAVRVDPMIALHRQ
jgi:predicted permease